MYISNSTKNKDFQINSGRIEKIKLGILKYQKMISDILKQISLNIKSLNGDIKYRNKLILLKLDYESIVLKLNLKLSIYRERSLRTILSDNMVF